MMDVNKMVSYFNISNKPDNQINYEEFLQFVLPCNNAMLRCQVTQRRPTRTIDEINRYDQKQFLDPNVEMILSQLIFAEVTLHLELEALKDKLIHTHDFTMKKAFQAVDDWGYGYIDTSNLKRFLVNMGYRHPSAHRKGWKKALQVFLGAVIRRFDMSGDNRVSLSEFKQSIDPRVFSPGDIIHN
jgi:hypothetical protein